MAGVRISFGNVIPVGSDMVTEPAPRMPVSWPRTLDGDASERVGVGVTVTLDRLSGRSCASAARRSGGPDSASGAACGSAAALALKAARQMIAFMSIMVVGKETMTSQFLPEEEWIMEMEVRSV